MVDIHYLNKFVKEEFIEFGPNKHQEVTRLLYEISKRENRPFKQILSEMPNRSRRFADVKRFLIKRRFPNIDIRDSKNSYMLPKLEIDAGNQVKIKDKLVISPKHFVIEQSVKDTALVQRLKSLYPNAQYTVTAKSKDFFGKKSFTISDYNKRLETFTIIKEEYDFFKQCPCSKKSVSCGLHVVNLGSGCGFECTYCYLQDYINTPGIIIPANLEDFFDEFKKYKRDILICSGEITDSLIFDHMTGYSARIVNFFRPYPKTRFEFKTKGDNIENLLKVKGAENIIVGWSINPPFIIDSLEHYTASLDKRLKAAQKCVDHGYKVGFHFDPMIYYNHWEKDYYTLVKKIFDHIDPKRIDVISIGTLRMTPRLKKIIENRYPDNKILDEELLMSYDGKLRYPFEVRTQMYKKIDGWIKDYGRDVYTFLCMEEKSACQSCESAPLKQYSNN